MTQKIAVPKGLKTPGKTLWDSIVGSYVLRPDELATLEQACFLADMIDAMDKSWRAGGSEMIATGSMGQEVVHPLITEIRTHRASLARLMAQLKLPDEGGATVEDDVSSKARAAASARWGA